MASNIVHNIAAAVTNQLDAIRGIARSHVKLGNGIGSPTFTPTRKPTPALKMQPVIDDHHKNSKQTIHEGKFGKFGGKFVPESLITCLAKLEAEFNLVLNDSKFQVCVLLVNYVENCWGRSPISTN